jgi:hypothetical protein
MTRSEEKAKRWRPWQFSLRALMLLALMAGVFCAGRLSVRNELQSLRQQQAMFEKQQSAMEQGIADFKSKTVWHLKTDSWFRRSSAGNEARKLFIELDRMQQSAKQVK